MIRLLQRAGAYVFHGVFPDARTPLQRRELLLTLLAIGVAGVMWAAAAQSGALSSAPIFGSDF